MTGPMFGSDAFDFSMTQTMKWMSGSSVNVDGELGQWSVQQMGQMYYKSLTWANDLGHQ